MGPLSPLGQSGAHRLVAHDNGPVVTADVLMVVSPSDDPALARLALASVTTQLRPGMSVIVVANGPLPTATRQLLDGAAGANAGAARGDAGAATPVRVVERAVCADLGTALNDGLSVSTGTWVIRQDPDDLSLPGRLATLLDHATAHDLDLLGSALIERDADGRLWLRPYPVDDGAIRRELARNNPFAHSTVIVRRERVLALGGYRRRAFMEDYDLWARLIADGGRVANLAAPLVVYSAAGLFTRRAHPASIRAERAMLTELTELGLLPRWRLPVLLAGRVGYRLAPNPVKRAAYHAAYRRPLPSGAAAATDGLLTELGAR